MNTTKPMPWLRSLLFMATASLAAAGQAVAAETITLHLAGDSTMASYPDKRPVRGWGQMLPEHISHSQLQIKNHALSGRSTKSFIDGGFWEKLRNSLQKGDYVIIQFGHNDWKKNDPKRYTDAGGQYRRNLERFIADVRAAGANPILATSIARSKWSRDGQLLGDAIIDYIVATREVAAAQSAPLLEMHERTRELETALGPEGSRKLHLYLDPGEHPMHPKGLKDNIHYSDYGARRVAELAVREIYRLDLPLKNWLHAPTPPQDTSAL